MAGRPADLSNLFPIPTVNTDRHKEKGRRSPGSVKDPAYRPFTPTTRSGGMNLAFENHLLFESLGWPDSESQSQQPTDGGSRRFFKRRVSLWTCHATFLDLAAPGRCDLSAKFS